MSDIKYLQLVADLQKDFIKLSLRFKQSISQELVNKYEELKNIAQISANISRKICNNSLAVDKNILKFILFFHGKTRIATNNIIHAYLEDYYSILEDDVFGYNFYQKEFPMYFLNFFKALKGVAHEKILYRYIIPKGTKFIYSSEYDTIFIHPDCKIILNDQQISFKIASYNDSYIYKNITTDGLETYITKLKDTHEIKSYTVDSSQIKVYEENKIKIADLLLALNFYWEDIIFNNIFNYNAFILYMVKKYCKRENENYEDFLKEKTTIIDGIRFIKEGNNIFQKNYTIENKVKILRKFCDIKRLREYFLKTANNEKIDFSHILYLIVEDYIVPFTVLKISDVFDKTDKTDFMIYTKESDVLATYNE